MATLKEALRSALKDWNTTTAPPAPTPTPIQTAQAAQHVQPEPEHTTMPTEATPEPTPIQTKPPKAKLVFDYILANPGKNIKEVSVALAEQNVGLSTTSTYVYQMIKAGLIHQDKDKTLYSLQPEYAPIRLLTAIATRNAPPKYKPKLKRGPKPKNKPTPKPKTTYPIDAPPTLPEAVTQPQNKLTPEQFADDIIASLGAQTAAILRRKLNEMFA
jgi:hypothetical protein